MMYTDQAAVLSKLKKGGMFKSKWDLESNIFAFSEMCQRRTMITRSDHGFFSGQCALDSSCCAHKVAAAVDVNGEGVCLHSQSRALLQDATSTYSDPYPNLL